MTGSPMTTLLLALALSFTDAGTGHFVHDAWHTENGLPQSSVLAILQTRDGYLWLGTQGGLVRFDGVKFTLFNPSSHPGLTSSRIRTLYEDGDGVLWIGTEDGALVKFAQGVFTSVDNPDDPLRSVWQIAGDATGGLWLSTRSGLVRYQAGRFTRHARPDGSDLMPETAIVPDDEGALWFGTRWGLVRYADGTIRTFTAADGLPHDSVNAVLRARDGSLWVGTTEGLARLRGGAVAGTYTTATGLTDNWISALHEDAAGNLWIGTGRGLNRIVGERIAPLHVNGLPSTTNILSVASDREGNVWVGTVTRGLSRLKAARVSMLSVDNGLPHPSAAAVTEDANGNLWIANTCGGLVRYRHGAVRTYTERDGLPADCVWSLLAARDGTLWVGTWGGGLARLTGDRVTVQTHRNSGLVHDVVLALYEDRDGVIWIGTIGGLHAFKDGRFTVYRAADGLVHDDVRFITQDRDGGIWAGTTNGVSRFAGGRFTNYTTANGLSHNSVRAIHQDADGVIWIGTYGGGLNRLENGRIVRYTTANGLYEDVVSRILEDDRGMLWMSGNRGLYRVSRAMLNDYAAGRIAAISCVSYGVTDGMRNHETNGGAQPAGWRTRDGRLWFPTIDGVASIDPAAPDNALPPPVAIERITADGRALDPGAPVVLRPGRTMLEVEYTALSLVAPEKTGFMYRLDGYDDAHVNAGARRVAYYSNLPPGAYTLRVAASNNDGVWNMDGAAVNIVVLTPFWATWWFRAASVVALAGVVLLAHRRRVRGLQRRQALQEAFTRQLIESQENERKRIARELHDTLGQSLVLIKNQAAIGHDRPAEAMQEISAMAAQAIGEVKEIAYHLRPYQLDRLGLTRALEALVERVATSTALQVSAAIDNIDDLLPKEAEINLYRIVQESLNNVMTHAAASAVTVAVARRGGHVHVTVEDNGRGFDRLALPPGHRGIGLAGIAERARLLDATHTLVAAPGRGTTVRLEIPLSGGPHAG